MIALTIPLYLALMAFALPLQIFAMVAAPVIALFVNKDGNLPWWLKWFQTPDATCFDEMWVAEHPNWSKYKIAWTWIARNPAYGFRKWAGLKDDETAVASVRGNVNIADGENGVAGWFLITSTKGFWNFSYMWHIPGTHSCVRGEWGWYLLPKAKGYDSVNTGMLQSDPIRFYTFGAKGN